jgi:hypothetical protein
MKNLKRRCMFYGVKNDKAICKALKVKSCKDCKFYKSKDDIVEIELQVKYKRGEYNENK